MASEIYEWQKSRLLPKSKRLVAGAIMTPGYGAQGEYSLYLPSPRIDRKITFSGGKPHIEFVGSCLDIPSIKDARNNVLRGVASPNSLSIIFADSALVEYSAALLATQYKLSDDDLTMLHSGKKWLEPLIIHALGGVDAVDALRKLDRGIIDRMNTKVDYDLAMARLGGMDIDKRGASQADDGVAQAVDGGHVIASVDEDDSDAIVLL